MFKRVFTEEWAYYMPFIAFFIFFVVFLLITVCALRLSKSKRERLAALPLDDSSAAHIHNPETDN
jgi:heme/copper-type cytochrome/quinol oxidase subunit 2